MRDLSSAGRASALQAEGHRFEPYRSHFHGDETKYVLRISLVVGAITDSMEYACIAVWFVVSANHENAGVAELADAQDLKSCGTNLPYRFDSGRRHLPNKAIN